jgi:hypothetical protein
VRAAIQRVDALRSGGRPGGPIDFTVTFRGAACMDDDARALKVSVTDGEGRTWTAVRKDGCAWRVRRAPYGTYRVEVTPGPGLDEAVDPSAVSVSLRSDAGAQARLEMNRWTMVSLARPAALDPSISLSVDGRVLTDVPWRRRQARASLRASWQHPDGASQQVDWADELDMSNDLALPYVVKVHDETGALLIAALQPPGKAAHIRQLQVVRGPNDVAWPSGWTHVPAELTVAPAAGQVVDVQAPVRATVDRAAQRRRAGLRRAMWMGLGSGVATGGMLYAAGSASQQASVAREATDKGAYDAAVQSTGTLLRVANASAATAGLLAIVGTIDALMSASGEPEVIRAVVPLPELDGATP